MILHVHKDKTDEMNFLSILGVPDEGYSWNAH
jgi:hypothetical protein